MTLEFFPKTLQKLILLVVIASFFVTPGFAQKADTKPAPTKEVSKAPKMPPMDQLKQANKKNFERLTSPESPPNGKVDNAENSIKTILNDRKYNDSGIAKERNWFADSLKRVTTAIENALRGIFDRPSPNVNLPESTPNIISVIAWIFFGGALIAFFTWGILWLSKRISPASKLNLGGMLGEDEPDRTADEWIVESDRLASEGKYREAVRCLYLACLVRFDEAHVARFLRQETNWEHLRRIQTSAKLPTGIDFKPPTQKFDEIWYGFNTNGQPDVDDFKAIYLEICQKLKIQAAA